MRRVITGVSILAVSIMLWFAVVMAQTTFSGFNLATNGGFSLNGVPLFVATAPTIVGTSCFTSGTATTATTNGTAALTLTVGGTPANTCQITFAVPAPNNWTCMCTDITTNSTTVDKCKQTASSTTTCTIGIFTDVSVAAAPVAADKVVVTALPQ